jgi:hypothetical protein
MVFRSSQNGDGCGERRFRRSTILEGVLRKAEFFGDRDLALIYIAKKLKEALALEKLLTGAGYDYLVETDTYRGGFIFQTARVGAFFYVLPEAEQGARNLMAANGFRPYKPLAEESPAP